MLKYNSAALGAGALLGAAFIYGTFGLFVRYISTMLGNHTQVASRFILAALVIFCLQLALKRTVRLPKKALLQSLALGTVFSVAVVLYTISVLHTTVANSVFLLYAGSIIASLIAGTAFLKEGLTGLKVLAILVAMSGLVMYADTFVALSIGVVTGFISGLFDGVANSLRKLLKGNSRNAVAMYSYSAAAVCASMLVLVSREQMVHEISLVPMIVTVIFVLLMVGLSHLLLYGFQHFDVHAGTVILATELLFAAILAWLFLHEIPARNELIGGILIFVASILAVINPSVLLRRVKAML